MDDQRRPLCLSLPMVQVERVTRESNFYPPERVKTFLMEVRQRRCMRCIGGGASSSPSVTDSSSAMFCFAPCPQPDLSRNLPQFLCRPTCRMRGR